MAEVLDRDATLAPALCARHAQGAAAGITTACEDRDMTKTTKATALVKEKLIKVETTRGTEPAAEHRITLIPVTVSATVPPLGKRSIAVDFRFQCPCCAKILVGEIAFTDDAKATNG